MQVGGGASETFDLGGQWVGTEQTDIMETLDELGLEVYRQYDKVTIRTKQSNINRWC